MLAISGQIATRPKAPAQGARRILSEFGLPSAPTVTLVWRRDRLVHLMAGLAGTLSFPLMVVAAIGSGLPFGIASSLAVGHLAAVAPGMAASERRRLNAVVSILALVWALLCLTVVVTGLAPALLGWEAVSSLFVAAIPVLAHLLPARPAAVSATTERDIACLESCAGSEAVIFTDFHGRLLGSTWAARRITGLPSQGRIADIAQLVELADRQVFSSALLRAGQTGSAETCQVGFIEDPAGGRALVTVKPVEPGRLAVILSGCKSDSGVEQGLCSDPVQDARKGILSLRREALGPVPEECEESLQADGVTNVGEVVEFALRLARPDAERAGVSVNHSGTGRDLNVACEHRTLTQILINLVNNAIKFSNHEGRVSVGMRQLPGTALIRIEDNGIGIAAADLERIFGFRARAGDGTRPGHGFGLAIVRDLVEGAGGTIVLTSEPGSGTKVDVRLPLAVGMAARENHAWQLAAE